jgi:peptide chain release factor 1
VAVLREPTSAEVRLDDRDLEFKACRGSGAGGQHRNTTDSAVQVTHKPTGIQVRVESERSQHQNKELAKALLRARLLEAEHHRLSTTRNGKRKSQVGSGMRGDKRRTVALQRDQVTDHITGKQVSAKQYLRGQVEDLW